MTRMTLIASLIAAGLAPAAFAQSAGPERADRPAFADLDADGDGDLSLEELSNRSRARAAAMFDAADEDGDGEISLEDMRAAAERREAERFERHVGRMFDRLDTDGDGTVTRQDALDAAEQAQMHGHRGGPGMRGAHPGKRERAEDGGRPHRGTWRGGPDRGGMARAMIHLGDTDGNGSLSEAEFDALRALRPGPDGQDAR
ncbi:EF-hand domain-containing protein [Tropicimonas sp. IMCC34011]|uniref:EF-hand domain-containing protein n=1 Tax=Tropicimonas sp. IMCC34011 TaxID=2248759 RepID=UPI0018E56A43|nr:EF-hand domain-containing protein [Tropicimonas sp. IMCC34011]